MRKRAHLQQWTATTLLVLLYVFFALAHVAAGQTNSLHSQPKLVWQVSLGKDPDWSESNTPIVRLAYGHPRVAFLGTSRVVISFLHGEVQPAMDGPDSGGKSLARVGSVRFKAIFLDAATGSKAGEQSWMTFSDTGDLIPLSDEGFVIHAGNDLRSYSKNFNLRAHRELPPTMWVPWRRSQYSQVFRVPGGRKMFLKQCNEVSKTGQHICSYTWVNVQNLQDSAIFPDTSPASLLPSEVGVARNMPVPDTLDHDQVHVWQPATGWKVLPAPTTLGAALFISDEKLLLYGGDETRIVNLRGEVTLNATVSRIDREPRASLRGNRIAFFDEQRRSATVRVFDMEEGREIARVMVRNPDSRRRDLALSESGEFLAILNGSVVQLFTLPSARR